MISLTSALLSLGLLTAICIGLIIFAFILSDKLRRVREDLQKAEARCRAQTKVIDFRGEEIVELRGLLNKKRISHEAP